MSMLFRAAAMLAVIVFEPIGITTASAATAPFYWETTTEAASSYTPLNKQAKENAGLIKLYGPPQHKVEKGFACEQGTGVMAYTATDDGMPLTCKKSSSESGGITKESVSCVYTKGADGKDKNIYGMPYNSKYQRFEISEEVSYSKDRSSIARLSKTITEDDPYKHPMSRKMPDRFPPTPSFRHEQSRRVIAKKVAGRREDCEDTE